MSKKIWLVTKIILLFLVSNGYCGLQFEKELAQKFCPSLQLHSGNQVVDPNLVEIIDKKTKEPFLMGKTEYFELRDESMRREYEGGGDGGFSVGGGIPLSPRFSLLTSFSSYKITNEKLTYISSTTSTTLRRSLDIDPVTISCIYNLSDKTPTAYIGGGIGYYSVERRKELLGVSSESEKNKTIGPHFLVGIDCLISPRVALNGEIKYSTAKIKDWGNMEIGGLSTGGGINLTLGKEGRLVEFEKWKKEPKKGRIIGTIIGGGVGGMLGLFLYAAASFGIDVPPKYPPITIAIVPTIVGGITGYDIGDRYFDKK